ncbi:helix-turn-helix protein [compost metagenome]
MAVIPERIKRKREEHRYSQRGLAKAANVPYSAVENIERGLVKSPKYVTIVAIAAVLQEDPAYFFEPDAVNNQQTA